MGPGAKDSGVILAAQSTMELPLRMKRKKGPQVQREEPRASKDCSQALQPNGTGLARVQAPLVLVTPLPLPTLPFAIQMPVLYLPHHCILEAHNLFPRFTGSQVKRNSAPG